MAIDKLCLGAVELARVPLDVVLHDVAVRVVDEIREGGVGCGPQVSGLKFWQFFEVRIALTLSLIGQLADG